MAAVASSGMVIETGFTAPLRAFANAPAEGQRALGSFAVARRITRVTASGTSEVGGSGIGSLACFIKTATGVSAENGTRPVKSS